MKLEQIKKLIKKYDRSIKPASEEYQAALVLLSSAFIGADVKKVSEFTNLKEEVVKKFSKNLRKNGVWTKDGKVSHSGWDDKETGGIGFSLDILIAMGMMKRA